MAHVKNRQIIDENCLINILLPSDVTNAVLGQKKNKHHKKEPKKPHPTTQKKAHNLAHKEDSVHTRPQKIFWSDPVLYSTLDFSIWGTLLERKIHHSCYHITAAQRGQQNTEHAEETTTVYQMPVPLL